MVNFEICGYTSDEHRIEASYKVEWVLWIFPPRNKRKDKFEIYHFHKSDEAARSSYIQASSADRCLRCNKEAPEEIILMKDLGNG